AWFIYDTSGKPTWLVMPGGQWTTNTSYQGDVYATTGADPRFGFDPAQVRSTKVGTAALAFSARDRGTLTYTVNGFIGTKQISRQAFGPEDTTPVGSFGDLWWAQSESGW